MGLLCVTNGEPQQHPKGQFSTTAEKQTTVTPLCVQTQCFSQSIYHVNNEKAPKVPIWCALKTTCGSMKYLYFWNLVIHFKQKIAVI